MQVQYRRRAVFMLSYSMYLSIGVGDVIKHFMAGVAAVEVGAIFFDNLQPQLIDLMRCVRTAWTGFTLLSAHASHHSSLSSVLQSRVS